MKDIATSTLPQDGGGGHPLLVATGIALSYGTTPALRDVSLEVSPGEIVVLTGKSGSGKTSLLYCLSGIVAPDRGAVTYRGQSLGDLGDAKLSDIRLREFGFVFQFGELVPELSILENVSLPLRLAGIRAPAARGKAFELLDRLGIASEARRRPAEVSGGQAQRAAVARALVHSPRVIFADEPTGSLDSENKQSVLGEFMSLARTSGCATVIVTHEPEAAAFADRCLEMTDGCLQPQGATGR